MTKDSNQIAAPKSTSTLVFGLLSMFQFILCCGWATGGLLGIILGMVALDKAATANEYYEEDPDSYTSKSMTFVKVGKIAAWLAILSSLFYLLLVLLWMFLPMFNGLAVIKGLFGA